MRSARPVKTGKEKKVGKEQKSNDQIAPSIPQTKRSVVSKVEMCIPDEEKKSKHS